MFPALRTPKLESILAALPDVRSDSEPQQFVANSETERSAKIQELAEAAFRIGEGYSPLMNHYQGWVSFA